MTFQTYYKLPAPQTPFENCVAHNGSLIPVPGRDIMAQGWYQGGISVFDWTDPTHPREIAYFDRGPMDSTKLRSEEHTSELQSHSDLVCRLLLEKKKQKSRQRHHHVEDRT